MKPHVGKEMKRKRLTSHQKERLIDIQDGGCNICDRALVDCYDADHIIPLHHGGTNEFNNFQIICLDCHRRKNNSRTN